VVNSTHDTLFKGVEGELFLNVGQVLKIRFFVVHQLDKCYIARLDYVGDFLDIHVGFDISELMVDVVVNAFEGEFHAIFSDGRQVEYLLANLLNFQSI
jgi:hypothetical protein